MTRSYHRHDPAAAAKRCSGCGETKNKAVFGPDQRHPDGLKSRCRDCCLAAYRDNRDVEVERMRAYYAANRERARERHAEYVRGHRDETRARKAMRRALERGARDIEPVHRLVVLERADGACGICGGDVDPFAFHVDHIVPLSRGGQHTYANTQPAHPSCNARKKDRLPEEAAA